MSDTVLVITSILAPLTSSIKEYFIIVRSDVNFIFYCLTFQLCIYFTTIMILIWYLIDFIKKKVPINIFNFVFAFLSTIGLISINIRSFYKLIEKNNLQDSKNIDKFTISMINVGIFIFCFFLVLIGSMYIPVINTHVKTAIKKYADTTFNNTLKDHIEEVVCKTDINSFII